MTARLAVDVLGRGPRLALVHGFTQNRRCWGEFASQLASQFEVVLVDAPGHGDSTGVEADLADGARLIGEAAGRATYLGYSMGGRHVLRLALDRPDVVARQVLIGASPGLADPDERAARRRADDALADRIEAIGVDAFLDEWLAQPLFASLPAGAACVEERRENTAAGLAASLRLAGTGAQEPLWDRLGETTVPTLLVVGADDAKFGAVAERMAAAMGAGATIVAVPGAGHAPQLERPEITAAVVTEWLTGVP
jgi:2-succinyl-6-hydroxy-2,4-cyclohexadiene-1-carboxylate synthase